MKMIHTIFDIADQYTTFLVDVWGVVYDGVEPFPEAITALNKLNEQGKEIIFVSNNPRPNHLAQATLKELGIKGEPTIVTSGDVMRYILRDKHEGQKVFHLGSKRNQDILKDIEVTETDDLDQSDFVLLSCFLEKNEDPTQFDKELLLMANQQKLVYCPNPDVHATHNQTLRRTAGYFARRLEQEFNGKAERIGKPNRVIFDYVAQLYPDACIDKSKMIMIGDTLSTDIQGGKDFGIATLFVQEGISKLLNETADIIPTYSIKKLK